MIEIGDRELTRFQLIPEFKIIFSCTKFHHLKGVRLGWQFKILSAFCFFMPVNVNNIGEVSQKCNMKTACYVECKDGQFDDDLAR